jgi:hypothetical protein
MKNFIAILFAFTVVLSSCDKEDVQSGTFDGPKATLYGGQAWTRVQLDADGNPLSSEFIIDDAALNSLPVGGTAASVETSLKFDGSAAKLPFMHGGLDWNPNGHEPLFIYGKPHFDFHFYMISEAERMTIPIYTADSVKFKNSPNAAYLPPTYINPGGGVPMMGAHWIDATSPEVSPTNPQPFTQTFIYGTYNGKVIFYEPMITLDFLKATTTFERSIPQPTKFQSTGYFPTKMKVARHDGITEVVLTDFVSRQAS